MNDPSRDCAPFDKCARRRQSGALTSLALACICVAVLSTAGEATAGETAALHGHMHGLLWRVGKYSALVSLDGKPRPYARPYPAFTDPEQDRAETLQIVKKIDENLADQKEITGLVIQVGWRELEPRQGKYDWDFLDRVVEVAHKNNVFYKLIIIPGYECPAWLYAKGIDALDAPFSDSRAANPAATVESRSIPIPWDETYLSFFMGLLRKVAERYKNDPLCYAVVLTGASSRWEEMHLPSSSQAMEKWKSFGDYKGKLVEFYKRLIDDYVQIFPYQQICPSITPPLPGMNKELEEIIGYGVEKYPDRFTLQNCQLHGRNDNTGNISYRLIMEYNAKVHNGLQDERGFEKRTEPSSGSLEQMILNYIRVDSEYLEMGLDAQKPFVVDRWVAGLKIAQSLGYEGYKQLLEKAGLPKIQLPQGANRSRQIRNPKKH